MPRNIETMTPLSRMMPQLSRALAALIPLVMLSAFQPTFANSGDPSKTIVHMATSEGDIVLELDAKRAPMTVDNFLSYVNDGFYDGTIFHRVIAGFMIQGGGFSADYQRKNTLEPIRNEANNGLKNDRFSIAMARTNAPHSATAQFFINTENNASLDYTSSSARGWGYAVFGRVVDGFDVVKKISGTITGPGGPFSRDAPRTQIIIEKVSVPAAEVTGTTTATEESDSSTNSQ